MKPFFDMLWRSYPRSEKRDVLYTGLGWSDIVDHPGYRDTCAIRMSVALCRAGVPIPGGAMRAKAGSITGNGIEPRQRKCKKLFLCLLGNLVLALGLTPGLPVKLAGPRDAGFFIST